MDRWVAAILLAVVLVVAAVSAWRTGKVPNYLTLPAILLGLVWWAVCGFVDDGLGGAMHGLGASALAFAAALIPFAVLFTVGGLGGGDVKLMAALGALSGSWQCVLSTAVYAFVLGAIFAILVMIRHRLVIQTLRRIFGAVLMVMARAKADTFDDSRRIPFALAICIGGLLAIAEVMFSLQTPWAWTVPGG